MAPKKRSREIDKSAPHIIFFRSLNVGGRNVIKMADLHCAMIRCGANEVKTYIQSGNCVYTLPHDDHDSFSSAVVSLLEKDYTIKNTAALWRSGSQLASILASFDVLESQPRAHVVCFLLSHPVVDDALRTQLATSFPEEQIIPSNTRHSSASEVLVYFQSGSVTKSKLNGEKIAKIIERNSSRRIEWTARNWATLENVCDIAQSFE